MRMAPPKMFTSPSLVLADPETLATLSLGELRSGMGEVVKHGILGDPDLFALCAGGWEAIQGGPIALVEDGDLILIDIPKRILSVVGIKGKKMGPKAIQAILEGRRRKWKPLSPRRSRTARASTDVS